MSSKKGRYEVFQGKDDKWYFNRIAGNGGVEHPSEGYSTRGNAIAAIGRCMEDTSHYIIMDREKTDEPYPMGDSGSGRRPKYDWNPAAHEPGPKVDSGYTPVAYEPAGSHLNK